MRSLVKNWWPIVVVIVPAIIALCVKINIASADASEAKVKIEAVTEKQHRHELRMQRLENAIEVLRGIDRTMQELRDEVRRNNRR